MGSATDDPVYVSNPHRLSWRQEYRIYRDRIELEARILFRTIKIPFDKIIEIGVRPKPVAADAFRRPIETWWSYNNDWATFHPHVYVRRRGWPPRIRFVPDNLDAFVTKCRELMLLRDRP